MYFVVSDYNLHLQEICPNPADNWRLPGHRLDVLC